MSESPTTPATTASGLATLPRWLRIALIAAGTAVLVLVIAVIIRTVVQTPLIPFVVTPADKLLPGSCLLEPGDEEKYTVVSCTSPHQQQVIAEVDLDFPGVPYTADSSLAVYAQETCNRLLEYRLYLVEGLEKSDYVMAAVGAPTLDEYTNGATTTRCAVLDNPDLPEKGGSSEDLTRDLYRAIP